MEYQIIMVGSDVDPPRSDTDLPLATELVMADCHEPRRTYEIAPSEGEELTSLVIPDAAESQKHPAKYDWTPKFCLLRNQLPRIPQVRMLPFSDQDSMGDVDTAVDIESMLKPDVVHEGHLTRADMGLNAITSLMSEDLRFVSGHPAGGDQVSACSMSSSAECANYESRLFDNNNTVDPEQFEERNTVTLREEFVHVRQISRTQIELGQKECLYGLAAGQDTCTDTEDTCRCASHENTCLEYFRTEDNLGAVVECKCSVDDVQGGSLQVCDCPEAECYETALDECACPSSCASSYDDDDEVDGQCQCPSPDCAGPDGPPPPQEVSAVLDDYATSSSVPSPDTSDTEDLNVVGSPTDKLGVHKPNRLVHLPKIRDQEEVLRLCKPATSPQFARSAGKKEPKNPLATNLPQLVAHASPPRSAGEGAELCLETLDGRELGGNSTSATDVLSASPLLNSSEVRRSMSDPNSCQCPKRKQEDHLFDCGPLNTNEAEHVRITTFPVLKTFPCKKRSSKIPKLVLRGTASKDADISESYVISQHPLSPSLYSDPGKNYKRGPCKPQDRPALRQRSPNMGTIDRPSVVTRRTGQGTNSRPQSPSLIPRRPAQALTVWSQSPTPVPHRPTQAASTRAQSPTLIPRRPAQTPITKPPSPSRKPGLGVQCRPQSPNLILRKPERAAVQPMRQRSPTLKLPPPVPPKPSAAASTRSYRLTTSTITYGSAELRRQMSTRPRTPDPHASTDLRPKPDVQNVQDTNNKKAEEEANSGDVIAAQEATTVETGKMLFKHTGVLAEISVRKTQSEREAATFGPTVNSPPRPTPFIHSRKDEQKSPSPSPLLRKAQSTMFRGARPGHAVLPDKVQARPPAPDRRGSFLSPPGHAGQTSVRSIMKKAPPARYEGESRLNKFYNLKPVAKVPADANENTNSAHSPDASPASATYPRIRFHFRQDPQMFSEGLKLPKTIRFDPTPQVQEFEMASFRREVSKLSGRGADSRLSPPPPALVRDPVRNPVQDPVQASPRARHQPPTLPDRVSRSRSRSLRRADPYPTAAVAFRPRVSSSAADPEPDVMISPFPLPLHPSRQFLLCRPGKEKED